MTRFASRLRWTAALVAQGAAAVRDARRSPDGFRAGRDARVHRTVAFAHRRVPYYRETMDAAGIRPEDVRGAKDLERLPVLDLERLSGRPEDFLPEGTDPTSTIELKTSGSTGAPRSIRYDRSGAVGSLATMMRERIALRKVGGAGRIRRVAVLTAPGDTQVRFTDAMEARLLRPKRLLPEVLHVPVGLDPEEQAERVAAFAPDAIHGYGSAVGRLLRHVADSGRPFPRPCYATFTSDPMPAAERALAVDRLGIPVRELYRCTEALFLGFECGEGDGVHVNEDRFAVRIVDGSGRDRPAGEPGTVVVSNLVNRGTVLLNHSLGDLAVGIGEPCPCGRPLPRLRLLTGRDQDWIEGPGGRALHPFELTAAFSDAPVWRWQIVQESRDALRVRVVPTDDWDRAAADRLREAVSAKLGEAVRVEIDLVDRLEEGGKVRSVVRAGRDGADAGGARADDAAGPDRL